MTLVVRLCAVGRYGLRRACAALLWNCAGEPIIGSSTRGAVRVCVARGALGVPLVGLRPCLAGALEGLGGVAAFLPLVLVLSPVMRSGRGCCVVVALAVSRCSEIS